MGVARIFFGGGEHFFKKIFKKFLKNMQKIFKKFSKKFQKFQKIFKKCKKNFKKYSKIFKKFWKILKNFLKKFPKNALFSRAPVGFFSGGSEIHQGRACKVGRRVGGSGGRSQPKLANLLKP